MTSKLILAASISFAASCLVSLVCTWLVRRLAPRLGLVNKPDGHRKLHAKTTALGGGLAVFLATGLVVGGMVFTQGTFRIMGDEWWRNAVGLALASVILVVVGLLDDRFQIRGRQKLFGQIVAAAVLAGCGMTVQRLVLFGSVLELGPFFGFIFTVFWLVGAINAMNLLDGIDGQATTIGLIVTLTIGVLAALGNHYQASLVAFIFAGALLGFLRFNLPPATIFLGDAGSMLIGLIVGALSLHASLKGPGAVLLAAPLAICTIPILDSMAAIMRRKLTGRSIYATDRAHLHHRLMELLGGNRKTLAFVAICCLITSAAALASVTMKSDLVAIITCAALVSMLAVTRVFGHTEVALLSSHAVRLGRSLAAPVHRRGSSIAATVRLQGDRKWEVLWETLVEWAEKHRLCEVSLDINLAVAQEGYHAAWRAAGSFNTDDVWRFSLPLTAGGAKVGLLKVGGACGGRSFVPHLEMLGELLEPFELQVMLLVHGEAAQAEKAPEEKTAAARPSVDPLVYVSSLNVSSLNSTGGAKADGIPAPQPAEA